MRPDCKSGRAKGVTPIPSSHHSNIPPFHRSNIPPFHHSIHPTIEPLNNRAIPPYFFLNLPFGSSLLLLKSPSFFPSNFRLT